jgi:hypothetical protein
MIPLLATYNLNKIKEWVWYPLLATYKATSGCPTAQIQPYEN